MGTEQKQNPGIINGKEWDPGVKVEGINLGVLINRKDESGQIQSAGIFDAEIQLSSLTVNTIFAMLGKKQEAI